jgi:peroxiredoxin Q/BCP
MRALRPSWRIAPRIAILKISPREERKIVAVKVLRVGDPAPAFTARSDSGESVSLAGLKGKRVVLYFYPEDDTAGCTKQACGFRDLHADLEKKNAVVLGVSPDDAKSHAKFKDKYGLPFPLLVDADHAIAEKYGVWQEKNLYGNKSMGIVRSHFVIDENGRIQDIRLKVNAEESPSLALDSLS